MSGLITSLQTKERAAVNCLHSMVGKSTFEEGVPVFSMTADVTAGTFSRKTRMFATHITTRLVKELKRMNSARVNARRWCCQKCRRCRGAIGQPKHAAPSLPTSPSIHSLKSTSRRDLNLFYVQSDHDMQHVQLMMRSALCSNLNRRLCVCRGGVGFSMG